MKPTREQVLQWARKAGAAPFIFKDGKQSDQMHIVGTGFYQTLAALAYAAGAAAMQERCANLVYANALACADGSMLQIYLGSNAAAIRALGDDALDSINCAAENNGEEL